MARNSARDVAQPSSDVYTGLLAISLGAMITGCVFLWLDYSQYGSKKAEAQPPAMQIRTAPAPGQSPGK